MISLRRNGISNTSTIPTTVLPQPSAENSREYSGFVTRAVVPAGSGIMPEKSPANSDASPVTIIHAPIMMPWYSRGASLPIIA